jgi:hypothetical protein
MISNADNSEFFLSLMLFTYIKALSKLSNDLKFRLEAVGFLINFNLALRIIPKVHSDQKKSLASSHDKV